VKIINIFCDCITRIACDTITFVALIYYLHLYRLIPKIEPIYQRQQNYTNNMKRILIINGHPDKKSFCFALAEKYKKGADSVGAGL
jgi:hypothetical protein